MPCVQEQRTEKAAAVLSRAVVRAARALDLSQKDVARVLGVSESTATRIFQGRPIEPETKEGEIAVVFLRLYRSLDALLGGHEANVRKWMHSPNSHLGGTPAEMIRSLTGLVHVTEYLDAMRGKT